SCHRRAIASRTLSAPTALRARDLSTLRRKRLRRTTGSSSWSPRRCAQFLCVHFDAGEFRQHLSVVLTVRSQFLGMYLTAQPASLLLSIRAIHLAVDEP